MNHDKWLREAAKHMLADGQFAWANTCEQAADAYADLCAKCQRQEAALNGLRGLVSIEGLRILEEAFRAAIERSTSMTGDATDE
jgi:hypothetical protein